MPATGTRSWRAHVAVDRLRWRARPRPRPDGPTPGWSTRARHGHPALDARPGTSTGAVPGTHVDRHRSPAAPRGSPPSSRPAHGSRASHPPSWAIGAPPRGDHPGGDLPFDQHGRAAPRGRREPRGRRARPPARSPRTPPPGVDHGAAPPPGGTRWTRMASRAPAGTTPAARGGEGSPTPVLPPTTRHEQAHSRERRDARPSTPPHHVPPTLLAVRTAGQRRRFAPAGPLVDRGPRRHAAYRSTTRLATATNTTSDSRSRRRTGSWSTRASSRASDAQLTADPRHHVQAEDLEHSPDRDEGGDAQRRVARAARRWSSRLPRRARASERMTSADGGGTK